MFVVCSRVLKVTLNQVSCLCLLYKQTRDTTSEAQFPDHRMGRCDGAATFIFWRYNGIIPAWDIYYMQIKVILGLEPLTNRWGGREVQSPLLLTTETNNCNSDWEIFPSANLGGHDRRMLWNHCGEAANTITSAVLFPYILPHQCLAYTSHVTWPRNYNLLRQIARCGNLEDTQSFFLDRWPEKNAILTIATLRLINRLRFLVEWSSV